MAATGCAELSGPRCQVPGISGLDLQRQLADANVYIPIIIITGHGDIPMSVRATKAGAVEFLTQPFRDQDLLDAIQLALDRDRARRQRGAEMQCWASASKTVHIWLVGFDWS